MSRKRIEDFGPYRDGVELFDAVVEDMELLRGDPRCYRLIGQQVGSADSICANIEEGFGRLSRTEFIRFLDIARGSARETLGRYRRMKQWLSAEKIEARIKLLDRIIARLTKSIQTLRANNTPNRSYRVNESNTQYEVRPVDADTLNEQEWEQLLDNPPDTRHPTP
jgi:four helix bundle protein